MPLSATTYWFASKEELLEQAFLLAAREETERLERLVLELAPLSLSAAEWAAAVAAQIASDIREEPARHVALFELGLEATAHRGLRGELGRWQEAHLRLAEMGCRAVGSAEPELDARIVVAALTGLMLEQLASPATPTSRTRCCARPSTAPLPRLAAERRPGRGASLRRGDGRFQPSTASPTGRPGRPAGPS